MKVISNSTWKADIQRGPEMSIISLDWICCHIRQELSEVWYIRWSYAIPAKHVHP